VLAAISAAQPNIIATNTSSFPIERLAGRVSDPSSFLGVHFFNPAEWIPGVEVVPGPATRLDVIARVLDVLRTCTSPCACAKQPGFPSQPLAARPFRRVLRCVEKGWPPRTRSTQLYPRLFGFRLPVFGPFTIADMAGLDVYASILDSLEQRFGGRFAAGPTLRALVNNRCLRGEERTGFRQYSQEVTQESSKKGISPTSGSSRRSTTVTEMPGSVIVSGARTPIGKLSGASVV